MKNYQEEFLKNNYVFFPNAVDKDLIEVATQYALFDEMQDFSPEGSGSQVPSAHTKYSDPLMESLLLKLQPTVEQVTGLSLYPTYSYYRVYRNGDDLKPHTDRPSCEVSVTLSFNYSYETSNYEWPIYMDGSPVVMQPGDIAVYRGIDVKHWRTPFDIEEDAWHVQAFLHYVDVNGPHSEWKFDKRETIGQGKTVQKSITKVQTSNKNYITYV